MKTTRTIVRRIAAFALIVVATSTNIDYEIMQQFRTAPGEQKEQTEQKVQKVQEIRDVPKLQEVLEILGIPESQEILKGQTSANWFDTHKSGAPQEASLLQPQGLLVETIAGQILQAQNSDLSYNPASGTKILTAFVVLQSLGPFMRFKTRIEYQGDIKNRVLTGTISFDGGNPFLQQEQLPQLVKHLNQLGVSKVFAEIVISSDFVFQNQTGKSAVKALYKGLRKSGLDLRTPKTSRAPVSASKNTASITVESNPLLSIVKDCLSRSDNLIAEKLGHLVGGSAMVSQMAATLSNLPPQSIVLQSSSGLGVNRITPTAMLAVLSHFKDFLGSHNLDLSAALPIAGIDRGTIFRRFANSKLKGAMTAKTGTLKETDFGASVLVGEINSKSLGKILFVIFQKGRNTAQLRQQQNKLVEGLLARAGGPGGRYK